MFSRRFAIVVLAAAVAACTDTPTTQSETQWVPQPEAAALQSYPGTLVASNLLQSGTTFISLAGWQTRLFQDLIGAEILVEGHMNADPESGLEITDFQLLAIDGHPVFDGMLEAKEEGYFIRARAGYMSAVHDVPERLAAYVGRRVFVAHEEGIPLRFGLLELDE